MEEYLQGSNCTQINIQTPKSPTEAVIPLQAKKHPPLTLFLILFPRPSSSTTGAGAGGDTGAGAGAETGAETGAITGAAAAAIPAEVDGISAIEVVTAAVVEAGAVLGTVSVVMGSVVAVSEADISATGGTGATYAEASSIAVVAATGAVLACTGDAGTRASSALRLPCAMVQATNTLA